MAIFCIKNTLYANSFDFEISALQIVSVFVLLLYLITPLQNDNAISLQRVKHVL